jgi:putative CocE/NonD family hydrolase
VLVYQTEPLQQDITIAGPVSPKLFVSTSGTDSDFVVKLIDVYPEYYPEPDVDKNAPPRTDVGPPVTKMAGFQQLVRGEPIRGKFRKSFEKPEAFVPGKMEEVSFEMPDINHTFRRGHRIMVQIQSSWFPVIDLNPQTFVNIPDAKPQDFKPATERVYRSQSAPSGIRVLVVRPEARLQSEEMRVPQIRGPHPPQEAGACFYACTASPRLELQPAGGTDFVLGSISR